MIVSMNHRVHEGLIISNNKEGARSDGYQQPYNQKFAFVFCPKSILVHPF